MERLREEGLYLRKDSLPKPNKFSDSSSSEMKTLMPVNSNGVKLNQNWVPAVS